MEFAAKVDNLTFLALLKLFEQFRLILSSITIKSYTNPTLLGVGTRDPLFSSHVEIG